MNDADISGGAQPGAERPRLLDSLREVFRARHYSRRTEETYRQILVRDGKGGTNTRESGRA